VGASLNSILAEDGSACWPAALAPKAWDGQLGVVVSASGNSLSVLWRLQWPTESKITPKDRALDKVGGMNRQARFVEANLKSVGPVHT
jgi:hypothetical protein